MLDKSITPGYVSFTGTPEYVVYIEDITTERNEGVKFVRHGG